MRFFVLATDYDGTIAHHGVLEPSTREALERLRTSGRKLVLVTGRELDDLARACGDLTLFDAVVAENGAVVQQPALNHTRLLAEPPPPGFVEKLRERGVAPLSVGHVIVATWQPHEAVVLDTIRSMGLELQVIFNKGAVMVLPSGINKAVGLRAALEDLGLSVHNAVAVGDAENDHAFLSQCECAVAVANALPALKERADHVTAGDHGRGVEELVAALVDTDLAAIAARLERNDLEIGTTTDGAPVRLPPHGPPVLLAGTSGGGKSTLATGFLEQLAEHGYQFCIIDPEGDYADLTGVTAFGHPDHPPAIDEVLELLATPSRNAAINLLGVPLADRPAFLGSLLPHLEELRARTGHPHWLIIDEAHHLLPNPSTPATLPRLLNGTMLVTVHPDHLARPLLDEVKVVLVTGAAPAETLASFAAAVGASDPSAPADPLPPGEALVWFRGTPWPPQRFHAHPPRAERRRHLRKYAAGELGPDKSFFFRGPDEKLNLRVQNLQLFVQVADGVDDDTWLYHLRRGDYARWFREAIKDPELAAEAEELEGADLSAADSRAAIRAAIVKRYTAAA